jgi:formate dehydrogenase subunit gamma
VVVCTIGIMITGPLMVLKSLFPPIIKQIAQPIHFICVFVIVAWLFIHVYMGAIFPEEKEAFFSMFSGKVSAWYARAHHEKWYNQMLTEEMEWEDKVEKEVLESTQLKEESSTPD